VTNLIESDMSPVMQVGDVSLEVAMRLRTLAPADIIPLLTKYQILPSLVKEMIVDQALTSVKCNQEEEKKAAEQLAQQYQITSDATHQAWLQQNGLTLQQFNAIAIRQFKLEKFKQTNWGEDLDSYFLQRKPQLDRVVYSLIRTADIGIAQEFYFRIQEGEESFAQLARENSQGPEAETDGLVGPVELHSIHPNLARMLSSVQPHQLLPPTQLGDWVVIVRLEKFLPAILDRVIQKKLLNERFQGWLQAEISSQEWRVGSGE
jgi:parvulin-like peptidyl-prolyl isomerase